MRFVLPAGLQGPDRSKLRNLPPAMIPICRNAAVVYLNIVYSRRPQARVPAGKFPDQVSGQYIDEVTMHHQVCARVCMKLKRDMATTHVHACRCCGQRHFSTDLAVDPLSGKMLFLPCTKPLTESCHVMATTAMKASAQRRQRKTPAEQNSVEESIYTTPLAGTSGGLQKILLSLLG